MMKNSILKFTGKRFLSLAGFQRFFFRTRF